MNAQAGNVASVPYQPYPGQVVAGLSPDQLQGIADTESASGIAAPYINSAAQHIDQATAPIWGGVQQFSPGAVSQYENPYTTDVINATQRQFNNQNQIQQQGIVGNAISQGAFGGDRSAVAQGITAGQQQLAQAPVLAGLRNQNYQQALQEFNQQQGAQIGANEANAWLHSQAGAAMAGLGQEALGTSLTGANALLGIGGLEQTQAQAGLNVPYQQWLAAQAYPYQSTGWLANIAEGLGGASGGTSSSTAPSPSVASQIGGGALAGVGVLGQTGAFGKEGYLTGSNGWFGSGGQGAAGAEQSWDYAASGGRISHRDAGGGIGGFPAPGVTMPTGVPDVNVSVVPGATGMGSAPASHGTMDILKNYGTTTKDNTPHDSLFGTIMKTAGNIAAGYFGGPAGGMAANALGSQVHFDRGGGIVPFPMHRVRAGGGGITANDNWGSEPVRHFAAGGYNVSTTPSAHSGPAVPMLSYTPGASGITGAAPQAFSGGIAPSSVQDYLSGQQSGAHYAAPQGYVPPPPPPAPTFSMADLLAAQEEARNLRLTNESASSGGGSEGGEAGNGMAAGGIVALDEGGGVPSETGSIVSGMLDAPAGNRVSPEEARAWWRLHGASPAGSSGIVQNMTRESGLRSDVPGDYDKSGNPTSLGLFQHHADRETALKRFAASQGASPTDPYIQMQFAKHELTNDMPGLDRTLATTDDPAAAEVAFRKQFERPKEDGPPPAGIVGSAGNIGTAGPRGASGIMPPDVGSDVVEPPAYSPWRTLTNVGLGILGGNSPNAGTNIGRGALQGVEISDKEKQSEATQALARQQASASNMFRKAQLTLEGARADQTERHQTTDEDLRRQGLAQNDALRRDQMEQRGKERADALMPADVRTSEWLRTASPDQRAAYEQSQKDKQTFRAGASNITPETKTMLAEQVLSGNNAALAGLGTGSVGSANRMAVNDEVTRILHQRDPNATGADVAAKTAEFMGEKAGARTAGTREATVSMAVTEAQKFMPLALAASEKVDRTQFPTINSIIQAYDKGTGDENIVRLAVATNSLTTAYSRAVTPSGVPTEGAQHRAQELLDKAWTKGQYKAAVDQLMIEMNAAKASPVQVQQEQRERISGRSEGASPAATSHALPPRDQLKTGTVYDTARGKAKWDGSQFIPVNP